MLKVFSSALVVLFSRCLDAAIVDFYLEINPSGHTWSLSASTDSPHGIAAFAVNLKNTLTGDSLAPRGGIVGIEKGFTIGNTWFSQQAFAGQNPLSPGTLVYGIGYSPVSNTQFSFLGTEPSVMFGDATVVPTKLYIGTYDPARPLPNYDYKEMGSNPAVVFRSTPIPQTGLVAEMATPKFHRTILPDFDGDGDIDGGDLVTWQNNFPKTSGATLPQGDADDDGDIDGADFVGWQTKFPGTPSAGTVPEPAAIALALLSLPAFIVLRRCWW